MGGGGVPRVERGLGRTSLPNPFSFARLPPLGFFSFLFDWKIKSSRERRLFCLKWQKFWFDVAKGATRYNTHTHMLTRSHTLARNEPRHKVAACISVGVDSCLLACASESLFAQAMRLN